MVTSGMAAVPSTIDDVTPQWLSAAFDGATVTDVRAERIAEDTGFSALLYRLHLVGEGMPSSVIVKLPAESEARGAMELLDGYRRELLFYRHVAGVAPMETPARLCRADDRRLCRLRLGARGSENWDNADHLAGLSLDRRGSVSSNWRVARVVDSDSRMPLCCKHSRVSTPRSCVICWYPHSGRAGRSTSTTPRRRCRPRSRSFAERFADSRLKHWRADWTLDAPARRHQGRQHVLRRRSTQGGRLPVRLRGAGTADIAYLVSQGLPTEVRRGHDKALVREYLAFLGRRCHRLLVRRGVAAIPIRRGLPDGASRHHAERLGRHAGTVSRSVHEAHRTGRGAIDDIGALEVFA